MSQQRTNEPHLGIIQLANKPLTLLGNLGNPDSFAFPVRYTTAVGGYVDAILVADPAVGQEYVERAEEMVEAGAVAIMATCGFAVVYQDLIAAAVDVPVGSSSLLLLSSALESTASPRGTVGVITFDTSELTDDILVAAGVDHSDRPRLVVAGMEGTRSWEELRKPNPELAFDVLRDDVLDTVRTLQRDWPDVEAILLECSATCPFVDEVRELTGLPVFDFLLLADRLMAQAGRNHV